MCAFSVLNLKHNIISQGEVYDKIVLLLIHCNNCNKEKSICSGFYVKNKCPAELAMQSLGTQW